MLFVFDITLVSSPAIALAFDVILAVFEVILFEIVVISVELLPLLAVIRASSAVILVVFASTLFSSTVILEVIAFVLFSTLFSNADRFVVKVASAALAVRPSAVIARTFALIPFVLEAIAVCCEVILAVLD
jgi:hypothetical protein